MIHEGCALAPPAEPSGPHSCCAGPVTARARIRGLARGPRVEGLRPSPRCALAPSLQSVG